MKHQEQDVLNKAKTDYLMCEIGGDSFAKLPNHLVSSVDFATKAANIPFGTLPLEGLVINEEGACLQIDAAQLFGIQGISGKYIVNVKTSKGIVSLRVNSFHMSPHQEAHKSHKELFFVDAIEELLKSFDTPINKYKNSGINTQRTMSTRSIALCREGSTVIGLEADGIAFFEHPARTHPLDQRHHFDCLVELENGELINGKNLSSLLGFNTNPESNSKKWVIGISAEGTRSAIIAEKLISLEKHGIEDFQYLNESNSNSYWLKHSKFGLVEIFNSLDFVKEKPFKNDKKAPPESNFNSIPRDDIAHSAEVGIKFKDFDLVLPFASVESVGEMIEVTELTRKPARNTIPTFDISKLFPTEMTDVGSKKRLITLKTGKKSNFALLVPAVYKPRSSNAWAVPHILPKPLNKLIKATQILEGRCELLLRDEFISELDALEFAKFKQECFCGWFKAH